MAPVYASEKHLPILRRARGKSNSSTIVRGSIGESHPSIVDDTIDANKKERHSQRLLGLGFHLCVLLIIGFDVWHNCHDALLTSIPK